MKNSEVLKAIMLDSSESDVSLLKPSHKKVAKNSKSDDKQLCDAEKEITSSTHKFKRKLFGSESNEASCENEMPPLHCDEDEIEACHKNVEESGSTFTPKGHRRSFRLKHLLASPEPDTMIENGNVSNANNNKSCPVLVCDTPLEDHSLTVRQRQIKYKNRISVTHSIFRL